MTSALSPASQPENILLARRDSLVPWVTDFGLAASTHSTSFSNSAGGRGTMHYKAPELFIPPGMPGGDVTIGPAVDVYSFGVLAWQVITGIIPWSHLTAPNTQLPAIHLAAHFGQALQRPVLQSPECSAAESDDWRAHTHPTVASLIEQCWDQDPAKRPTFTDVAARLETIALQISSDSVARSQQAYQRRARAAEEEAEATRRRLAEYEAAVQEERRRATLAAQDMADLQSQLDGLKVTAKQRTDEAARWHAQADTLAAQAQVLAPPATWTSHPDLAGGQEVVLQPGSPEWSDVERRFIAGLGSVPPPVNRRDKSGRLQGITAIKRIENHRLWKSYATYRESLKARAADEGRAHDRYEQVGMFHGTSPAVIPKVVSQGFNRIFNGANAVVYGKGVYFALTSNYSDSYAHADAQGVKHMFICRVVVGEFCKGNNAQPVPDERLPASHVLYDSTTNDMNDAAREMYVVYHDAQAYPEYLVEYRMR